MDIKACFDTVPLLIIDDVFSKEINEAIIQEALDNKKNFKDGTIGAGLVKSFRSNMTAMYDNIYDNKRDDSVLLKSLDELFHNKKVSEVLASSHYPLNEFGMTNTHETQVSRYGDDGQHYDWHIDRFNNYERVVTFVYYFNTEPKKYTGGEIEFTDSPIYKDKTIMENPNIKTLIPKNNMGVFFSSTIAHRVLPTKSPKTFKNGRFSVNCWIGKR